MTDPVPPSTSSTSSPPHRKRLIRTALTFFKIAIAVLGIWYVARGINWQDTAILPANGRPLSTLTFVKDTQVKVLGQRTENGKDLVRIQFPSSPVEVRTETQNGERTFPIVFEEGAVIPGTREMLGISHEMEVGLDLLSEVKGQRIHGGLRSIFVQASAKWYLLFFAWLLLGIPFVVTAIRWRNLMRPQGIEMPLGKCLQLTFVGQFYSIILPGITGGDLVKIVYAARLTGSKTKSFITIILDRVIGLVALMVIAGTSAAIQLILNLRQGIPVNDSPLFNVFLLIAAMLLAMTAGATIYFSHRLRRICGIEWFIANFKNSPDIQNSDAAEQRIHLERLFRIMNATALAIAVVGVVVLVALRWMTHSAWALRNTPVVFGGIAFLTLVVLGTIAALLLHRRLVNRAAPLMQSIVQLVINIDETLHVYRGHFGLIAWAFIISLISQMTLPLSAWLSGLAFGMNAPVTHFMAYVPLAVLAASLPISPPQGAGFLEWVLDHFFVSKGAATASQAFALTQSVRFLPILWNLFGAYWVITGKFSRNENEKIT